MSRLLEILLSLLHVHLCATYMSSSGPCRSLMGGQYQYQCERLAASVKDINKLIIQALDDPSIAKKSDNLRDFIRENQGSLNQVNAITLMHRCCKRKVDVFKIIDADVLLSYLDIKTGVVRSSEIGNALYSLQNINSVGWKLKALHLLTLQLDKSSGIFDGQIISNALFGLKSMGADRKEVRQVLAAISRKIIAAGISQDAPVAGDAGDKSLEKDIHNVGSFRRPMEMCSKSLGASFFGLQRMSSEHVEVRNLIHLLSLSLRQYFECFDILKSSDDSSFNFVDYGDRDSSQRYCARPRMFANIVMGLKGSSDESFEVRKVFENLAEMLERDIETFNQRWRRKGHSQDVVVGSGMTTGSSTKPDKHTNNNNSLSGQGYCDDFFAITSQEFSMLSFGLQGKRSSVNEIGRFIAALVRSLDLRNEPVILTSADEIGPVLSGLQDLDVSDVNVRRLLRHVTRCLRSDLGSSFTTHQPQAQALTSAESVPCSYVDMVPSSVDNPGQQQQQQQRSPTSRFRDVTPTNIANMCKALKAFKNSIPWSSTQIRDADEDDIDVDKFNTTQSSIFAESNAEESRPSFYQDDDILDLVSSVTSVLRQYSGQLSGRVVANALYGLQKMDMRAREVREYVKVLTEKMGGGSDKIETTVTHHQQRKEECGVSDEYTGQHMAMCCYGLQTIGAKIAQSDYYGDTSANDGSGMSSSVASPPRENATIDTVLAVAAKRNRERGVRKNSSAEMAVLPQELNDLLFALSHHFRASPHVFDSHNTALAVYGLKSLSSDSRAVRRLVLEVADKILPHTVTMTSADFDSSSVDGQNIGGDEDTDKTMIRASTTDDADAFGAMSGQEIAMAMLGLRNMGSEWSETQRLLSALSLRVLSSPARMNPYEISAALNGLRCLGGGQWSRPQTRLQTQGQAQTQASELIAAVGKNEVMNQAAADVFVGTPTPTPKVKAMQTVEISGAVGYGLGVRLGLDGSGFDVIGNADDMHRVLVQEGGDVASSSGVPLRGSRRSPGGGRKRMLPPPQLLKLLNALAMKVETRVQRLSPPHVAAALYGFQGLSAEITAVRRIAGILAEDLSAYNNITTSATYTVSTSAFISSGGGVGMEPVLAPCKAAPLGTRDISMALFGMQNMTSRWRPVRRLLGALAGAIDRSPHPLTAQAVGNAFYGLQGMSSEHAEVRQVLAALTRKVLAMPSPSASSSKGDSAATAVADGYDPSDHMLTGQHIGNALWGLRKMTSENEEVRQAVGALARKVAESSAELSGQNLGNAFYSLHAMSNTQFEEWSLPTSDHEDHYLHKEEIENGENEITLLLRALALKLVKSQKPFSGLDVGMSLYGLKNMDAASPEVRVILGSILHKIKVSASLELQMHDLSMAIVGVLGASKWIKEDFLAVLAAKTPGMSFYSGHQEPEGD